MSRFGLYNLWIEDFFFNQIFRLEEYYEIVDMEKMQYNFILFVRRQNSEKGIFFNVGLVK